MVHSQNLTTIYIIRHGETEFNKKEIMMGYVMDSPLTEKGKQQAKKLARVLSTVHFDAVFSSDLSRAHRTAQIITLERKLAITTTKALREQSYGRFEGKTYTEFHSELKSLLVQYNALRDTEKLHFRLDESMETDHEAGTRFITFIREIAVAYAGKTILLVSHGDVIKHFLIHIGYATYDELPDGSVLNCSYIKLESDGVDFFVKDTQGIDKK